MEQSLNLKKRLTLHNKLVAILGSDHVYFQPGPSITLKYPCIIYKRSTGDTKFADNKGYRFTKKYQITIIDEDPDSGLIDEMAKLPMCVFDRHYTADNLNHDVFNLYF